MKNKMKIAFFYLSIAVTVVLYLSCKPSRGNSGTQSASFVNKKWEMKALSVAPAIDWDLDGKKDTDIFALMEGCEKDDVLILKDDKIVVRNAGKMRCDEEEAQEHQTGIWSYDGASKKLVLKEDQVAQELTIVENSANKLVVTYKWNATNGTLHKMTVVYFTR
ncbi:hypothetical protein J7E50_02565 [Pedobacter sp. ISL-68]|uniref:hypothetical protein n=1 Tax=unclassified Pedobacter TaxID=2628915 RepID=UPI001BE6F4A0|nr:MULTISPECIES: hypothetical protein [unclassified Pedobacter]MBT2560104.1 hypothetical protein [Pedobacter sp. ISL-64]MBT2589083.1 hypothetical protein [Pedobacter sp. ISL-68]